jgi:ribosomal protein L5
MENINLYYKYIIRPQFLLKFPKIKDSGELSTFVIRKIRLNMFLLDAKQNYYLYLYNICILMRLLFNKYLYIKKVNKNYTLNKIHIQLSMEGNQIYVFLDVFGTILLPLFENFNMGLKDRDFDMFGNYLFEFNYCDPIFMSKNTVII